MDSKVVVVSGLMAGGKTTLINALHQVLPSSTVLSFDDYDIDQLPSAPPIDEPLMGNVSRYDISALVQDVQRLNGKQAVILLDFPFGNRHPDLEKLVDLTIYNQVPLDIVLARTIIRDYAHDYQGAVEWARIYLDHARSIYQTNEQFVMSKADLVLDGTTTLAERVTEIIQYGHLRAVFSEMTSDQLTESIKQMTNQFTNK